MISTLPFARRSLATHFFGINQCRRLATTDSLQQVQDSGTTEANQSETTSSSPPEVEPIFKRVSILQSRGQTSLIRRVESDSDSILKNISIDRQGKKSKDRSETISQLSSTLKKFTLAGKVAVITGGSRGHGYRMAEAIANAGAKAIAFLESEHEPCGPGQSAVIRLYKNTDISARLYQVELRSDKAMEEVMTEIDNDLGSLDILLDFSPVLNEYANDDILRVKGSEKSFAFVASRAFTRCRLLKPREDEASIITVAPFSHNHQPDSSAFLDGSSSKVVQFGQVCKSLAIRWARHQIRVNCVEMRYHPKTLRVGPHTPRIQFPELDSAVVWLASPASKWVTGSRFNLLEIPHPSYTAQNNVVTIQWYLKNDVSPPAIAKS